ncbi:HAD-IA family hydrolase [Enterobacterales bacterium AE_CKDN230030158-1A_HGKHYDSX7]
MLIETRAILLDMDGTLVQSTAAVEVIWSLWCQRHGLAPQTVLSICHGVRSQDVIGRVAPHLDLATELAALNEMEREHVAQPVIIDGADHFLGALSGQPWAVVTSASRAIALDRLERCGLPLPDVLVGSDDVAAGKPDPEPYRLGAQRLGMAPQDCLAFEDAPAGVQSALAAGCQVIQIGSGAAFDPRVRLVVPDWSSLHLTSGSGNLRIELSAQS